MKITPTPNAESVVAPTPQPLLYNNLEIQNAFDIYTSYSQLLSQNDSFLCPTNLISPTKLSFITIFYNITPSQQPQTQTSNPNEDRITNEDLIIWFHKENMNDFSEHEDQELFHHNNDQSDDGVFSYQHHFRCNITNLVVQWTWTSTTYHNTLIITISFSNKTYTTTNWYTQG